MQKEWILDSYWKAPVCLNDFCTSYEIDNVCTSELWQNVVSDSTLNSYLSLKSAGSVCGYLRDVANWTKNEKQNTVCITDTIWFLKYKAHPQIY